MDNQIKELVNTEIISIKEEEARQVTVVPNSSIIEEQENKDLKVIAESKAFTNKSMEVTARSVNARLDEKALNAVDKETENAYRKYELLKRQEKLDYQTKLEKDIIKQEVRAEVNHKKREIAKKRYGYLYTPIYDEIEDQNGVIKKVIVDYKDFTPNKFINKTKEAVKWYENLSTPIRKAIWTTVKIVFGTALGVLVIWGIISGVKWVVRSGILI